MGTMRPVWSRAWVGVTLRYVVTGVACVGVARWALGDETLAMKAVALLIALGAYLALALASSPALRGALTTLPTLRLTARSS